LRQSLQAQVRRAVVQLLLVQGLQVLARPLVAQAQQGVQAQQAVQVQRLVLVRQARVRLELQVQPVLAQLRRQLPGA